jgi:hypothetical protein
MVRGIGRNLEDAGQCHKQNQQGDIPGRLTIHPSLNMSNQKSPADYQLLETGNKRIG